jgi:hypothetical protein
MLATGACCSNASPAAKLNRFRATPWDVRPRPRRPDCRARPRDAHPACSRTEAAHQAEGLKKRSAEQPQPWAEVCTAAAPCGAKTKPRPAAIRWSRSPRSGPQRAEWWRQAPVCSRPPLQRRHVQLSVLRWVAAAVVCALFSRCVCDARACCARHVPLGICRPVLVGGCFISLLGRR